MEINIAVLIKIVRSFLPKKTRAVEVLKEINLALNRSLGTEEENRIIFSPEGFVNNVESLLRNEL